MQVSAHLHLLPPCALLTHSSRTPYSLLTARSLPLTPYPSPLPLLLQPPSRAETSLQAAAEPAVGAAQTLRVLSARVLPPQPLQLQLRVGGWGGSFGAAEDGRWAHVDGLARVLLARPATQPLYALVRALGPAVLPAV